MNSWGERNVRHWSLRLLAIGIIALSAEMIPVWAARQVLPNNNFANAITIPAGGGSVSGSNVGATREGGEPIHAGSGGGKSVWWKWTAASYGWVTIDTAGSNFDTVVGVYTGTFVSSLTEITSGDDSPSGTTMPYNFTSVAIFEAIQGTTYYIAVDGYAGDSGTISLSLTIQSTTIVFPVPPADFDSTAASWTLDTPVNGSRWAFDATPSTFPSGISRTGVSLNFNNGTDYAGCTLGGATSPSINISGLSNPVLEFWCNYDTETRGTQSDQRFLRIYDGAGALLQEWQLASVGYTFNSATDPGLGPCGEGYVDLETGVPATAWHRHRLFLDPAWTAIRVQFYFKSMDDLRNNYAGWAIDDLVVKSHPTMAPSGWPNITAEPSKWTNPTGALERIGNQIRFPLGTNNVGTPGVHQIIGLHPQAILDRSFMFYDPSHGHFHMSQYSEYALWRDTPSVGFRKVVRGRKRSFCQEDTELVGAPTNSFSPGCGASYQAISYGWRDIYGRGLAGQEIDVTGLPTNVQYYLTAVVDPLNRVRELSNMDQMLSGQFTLPAGDRDPIPVVLTNPFPQTSMALTISAASVGTSPAGTNAVHVVGTGFDTAMSMVVYGPISTQIAEAPMYTLTIPPAGGPPYTNGATDMWVDIPAGFPNPVSIDVLRASGHAASFRTSGTPTPCGLVVDPALSLLFSGPAQVGPFTSPSNVIYLTNTGPSTISWTATKNEFWVNLSSTGGSLMPGQSTAVTVTATSGTNPLAPGYYADLLSFANTTNGIGSTTRSVDLTVTGVSTDMVVSPTVGLWASRTSTTPPNPAGAIYTISNFGTSTIGWSATPSQAWITVIPPSDTLAAGMQESVTVAFTGAAPTTGGPYYETVQFTGGAPGNSTTRSVTLQVTAAAPPALTITNPSVSPTVTSSNPFVATGTTAGTSVSWTNLSTGASGNGTVTGGNWSASISLAPGDNVIAITIFDATGGSNTQSFILTNTPPPGGGGGGGGGGCGGTGLEAIALLGLLRLIRRR